MRLLDADLARVTILYLGMVMAFAPLTTFPALGHDDVMFITSAAGIVVILGLGLHQCRLSTLFDRSTVPLPQIAFRQLGVLEGAAAVVFGTAFALSPGTVGGPELLLLGTLLVAAVLLVAAGAGRSIGRLHWRSLAAGSYVVLGTGVTLFAVGLGISSAADPVNALLRAAQLLLLGVAYFVLGILVALDWDRVPVTASESNSERASPIEEATA